jgi:hypothetical protein
VRESQHLYRAFQRVAGGARAAADLVKTSHPSLGRFATVPGSRRVTEGGIWRWSS